VSCDGIGHLPNNVRCGILILHDMWLCFVNPPSQFDVYVDVIGGNRWFLNSVEQNAMGKV
jgi:hypothetical protein